MERTPNSAFKKTPLNDAASNGDLPACQNLVRNGAHINALDESGWSPLVHAVQGNHVDVSRYLLESGALMQYTYQREDTPEERAKQNKQYQELDKQFDLAKSMEETFKDLPGDLREEITSEDSMRDMRKTMIDFHFEPSTEHAIEHCTTIAMLKLLVIDFKTDINFVGGDGYWPLSSFAESDDLDAVKWLLENGADPNTTSTGETTIFKAIQNDNLKIVKLLIQHGAKIDVQDVDGWSVLFPCKSLPMAKYLIERGADPKTLDQAGFPCWNWAEGQKTKAFLKQEALKRGLKKWTDLSNNKFE